MDLQELINAITSKVLEQLQEEAAKPRVRVLHAPNPTLEARLKEALGDGVEICFASAPAWTPSSAALPQGANGCTRCILPFLSCSGMAALAAGSAPTPELEYVLHLLLAGQEVEVLDFEYKAYAQSAPGPLYRLYASQEDTLSGYGLKAFKSRPPEEHRFWDKLVTAQAVEQAYGNGASVLVVPVTAIVTPLAVEAAKERNVTIRKQL